LKTRTKIIIDSLFGTPAVYLINIAARLLGFILRIDHSLNKDFKTIVISKYVGLGSIIQATPLLQTLRKNFPQAQIIFLTTEGNRILLEHIPEVNSIITVSDKSFFKVLGTSFAALKKLWRIKPDLFIDLEFYSNYSSIMTTMSKATNRLGFYREGKTYRKGVYNYLVPFSVEVPISQSYLQFAEKVNGKEKVTSLKLSVNNSHLDSVQKKLNLSPGQKYMVVNPNASDLRLERRWPKENFVKILSALLEKNKNRAVVLIGSKDEASYVSGIYSALPKNDLLINSAGKISLAELITLIANAELMLTNDTGPMHMAFATRTKTVSLFGPCSPKQYGGTENSITFYKSVHCSPCVHKHLIPPCHGDNQCMKRIRVEEVEKAVTDS
jgi:lipopolysaccharide heptosyltransferase II